MIKNETLFQKTILDDNIKKKILNSKLALEYGFKKYDNFIKKVLYDKLIDRYDYFIKDEKESEKFNSEIQSFLFTDIMNNYTLSLINMQEHILNTVNFTHDTNKIIKKNFVKIYNYINISSIDYDFNIKNINKELDKYIYKIGIFTLSQSFYNSVEYIYFLKEIFIFDDIDIKTFYNNKIYILLQLLENLKNHTIINYVKVIKNFADRNYDYSQQMIHINKTYHIIFIQILNFCKFINKYINSEKYDPSNFYGKKMNSIAVQMSALFDNNILIDYNFHNINTIMSKLNDPKISKKEKDELLKNPIFDEIKKDISIIIDNLDSIFTLSKKVIELGPPIKLQFPNIFEQKYLKYKHKYLKLKNLIN